MVMLFLDMLVFGITSRLFWDKDISLSIDNRRLLRMAIIAIRRKRNSLQTGYYMIVYTKI